MSDKISIKELLEGVEVEWKPLNEVCEFKNGFAFKSNLFKDSGLPIIRITNIDGKNVDLSDVKYFNPTDYKENTDNYQVNKNDILIAMSGATTGKIGFYNYDKTAYLNQRVGKFIPNEKKLKNRYLYHLLLSKVEEIYIIAGGGAQPNLSSNILMSKIQIPIPYPNDSDKSLEVQSEIVRILDNFTELTAELRARKKQYEYYREQLISNSTSQIEKLEDIAQIYLGLTYTPTYVDNGVKFISAQNTSGDFLDLTNVKYISQEEYNKSTSNAKPKRGDVLFTRVGSNLGHPVIVDTDEELCIFVSLGFIRVNPKKVLNSYIKHWMNTDLFWEQVRKNVHGSAKVNLNTGWLKKFDVFLPSIEEQMRIVNILDKFDTLTNSISEGLPKEIELRTKQYEYYRDLLLTFPKKEVEV